MIVKYQGKQNKKDFFNAQFCPTKEDIRKAVKNFLKTWDEKMPKKVIEAMTKETINRGGVSVKSEINSDWFEISFEKL